METFFLLELMILYKFPKKKLNHKFSPDACHMFYNAKTLEPEAVVMPLLSYTYSVPLLFVG